MKLSAKILFIFLIFISSIAVAESPKKYRIGAILPLTGQVASMGAYLKNGLDLAYQQLPKEQREKIDLVYEDDQFNPTLTIAAYRKLNSQKHVDAVFVLGSPTANALGPITEREKVILVGIGASDPSIAIGKHFSFIHWVIPPVLGEKLATELVKRDLKRLAILAAQTTGALADADALTDALDKRGRKNTVIHRQDYVASETDFRSTLTKLREKNIDGVIAVLFPGAISSFAKQFRASGIKAELIGIETFEDQSEVKASAGALEGAWYVNASDPTEAFIALYKENFKQHPGWGAANAFDTLNLLVQGVVAGQQTSEQMRDFLGGIRDFSGAAGTYSASGDNRFTLPAALKQIQNSAFVKLH
jgi:branched-chain amino acid transport system substrate-binding protein